VIALRHIWCVALLAWSILTGALAQDIPSGFKVDRYVRVWEHNPFNLVKPAAPERPPPAFEKLFLASWLKDSGREVVLVQNSETNEVQRITAVPNQNNLRLVEMHPNPNPQFVEVVISDGKEQGTVKFRVQPSTGQTSLGAAGQAPNHNSLANPPSSQRPDSPPTLTANQGTMHRIYPGALIVHTEGASAPTPAVKQPWGKRSSPDSAAAQLTPGRN
jgi:hypothetical protein